MVRTNQQEKRNKTVYDYTCFGVAHFSHAIQKPNSRAIHAEVVHAAGLGLDMVSPLPSLDSVTPPKSCFGLCLDSQVRWS